MRIWKLYFEADKYDNLDTFDEMTLEEINSFDGRSKKDNWKAIRVVRLEPEKGLKLSDAPAFEYHMPIFNKKSVDVLHQYLVGTAEVLPLENDEDDFYFINVIKILDCINYEKSEYKTFKNSNRIMRFKKYSFDEEKIGDINLFKIMDEPLGNPFVTDEFRNAVLEAGLTGFKFKLVWDSEQ